MVSSLCGLKYSTSFNPFNSPNSQLSNDNKHVPPISTKLLTPNPFINFTQNPPLHPKKPSPYPLPLKPKTHQSRQPQNNSLRTVSRLFLNCTPKSDPDRKRRPQSPSMLILAQKPNTMLLLCVDTDLDDQSGSPSPYSA